MNGLFVVTCVCLLFVEPEFAAAVSGVGSGWVGSGRPGSVGGGVLALCTTA